MNEKTKRYMKEQRDSIFQSLKTFELAVYEDEIAEDEEEELLSADSYNFFTLDFGEFRDTQNIKQLTQTIVIEYYSENKNNVDEMTVDLITMLKSIKGINFDRTVKERLKMKDTERYIDRVSIILKRMIPIVCC